MAPQPQLSICIPLCLPLHCDKKLVEEFHDNLSRFFQKIPLLYEVLFAVNPDQEEILSFLLQLAERNPHYRIIENQKTLGRAQSIQGLFAKAKGDILVPMDLDLTVPLSEILKILEAFFSDNELEVVFGNRFKAKKNIETQMIEQDKFEKFFMGVLKEKTPWKFADPFFPILGLRRTSFEKIEKDLKGSGWHWSHEVQRNAQSKGLKVQEIPLYMGSRRFKIPRSEALHLLNFILFRI